MESRNCIITCGFSDPRYRLRIIKLKEKPPRGIRPFECGGSLGYDERMKNEISPEKKIMSFSPPKGNGLGGEQGESSQESRSLRELLDDFGREGDLPVGLMAAFVGIKGHCAQCEPKKTAESDGWGREAQWWKVSLSSAHGRGSSEMGMGSLYMRPPSVAEMMSGFWQSKSMLAQINDEADVIQEGLAGTVAEARRFIRAEQKASAIFDRLMGPLSGAEDEQELAKIVADMAIHDPRLLSRSGARLIGALDLVALCGSMEQALRLANGHASKEHMLGAASLIEDDADEDQREVALALGALAEAVELSESATHAGAAAAKGTKRL